VADERGHVFVNLEDKSEVVKFDPRTLKVESRWPLAPGEEPTGLALDHKHGRLFVACANKLMVVMNADNGKVVATLPIGDGVDGAAFDPETGLAFSPNGSEGTMTIIHEDAPDKFSVLESVATQKGARTIALDAKTHKVFLVSADFGPPPAPTADRPHPRPSIVPGTFALLVLGK
jgi:DNA-binding beta-propeller fold protein YncE